MGGGGLYSRDLALSNLGYSTWQEAEVPVPSVVLLMCYPVLLQIWRGLMAKSSKAGVARSNRAGRAIFFNDLEDNEVTPAPLQVKTQVKNRLQNPQYREC